MRPLHASQFVDMWPLFAAAIGISATFYFAQRRQPPVRRLLSSLHGVLVALALFYAVVAGTFTWDAGMSKVLARNIELPFHLCLLASLGSVGLSFFGFAGRRTVLLLHMLTIPLIFAAWLVGGMEISHLSL